MGIICTCTSISFKGLMVNFSANWSASDRHIYPYNSGTEAQIEVPPAPENRER